MKDLFPPDEKNAYEKVIPRRVLHERVIVETYPYTDEHGEILYEKVRYDPKDFSQRRPDGKGGWIWNLEGVRRVPFQLCEMIAKWKEKPDWPILMVAGEKDVLTAESLGMLATTVTEGEGSGWDDDTYPAFFRNRRVVIIPDNDRKGWSHAEKVFGCLAWRGAAELRLLELPDLEEKGDLTDWVNAGGTRDVLLKLIRSTPYWRRSSF